MGNCFGVENSDHSNPKNPSAAPPLNSKSGSTIDSTNGNTSWASSSSGDNLRQTSSKTLRGNLYAFSYADLKTATRQFHVENLLGEGGFGPVYKGHIDEQTFMPTRPGQGMVIAVKKLNLQGVQGHKEWLTEVHFLGELHHDNLVKLLGFCYEDEHRLLVYEFLHRGSLENHLFRKGKGLSWVVRMKIAAAAAKGLAFLHHSQRPVIYRDFKASNILLDSQYNAKLSDFGLAKDGPTGDKTHVTTRIMGTFGYAAPEYVATGHLSAKSDVYSFGVVLLEILSGRRAVDKNRPGGEQNLVEWAGQFLTDKRKVGRIIDHRLEGQYSLKGAQQAADVALRCLNPEAKSRPTMQEVVELLEPLVNQRELSKYIDTNAEKEGGQTWCS